MFDAREAVLALMRRRRRGGAALASSRVASVLLLVDADGPLMRASIEGLLQKWFPVDSELVHEVYWSSPPRLRPQLGALSVMTFLGPGEFQRIWRDAVRRSRTSAQRGRLAEALVGFLNRHPDEADEYALQIRGFCRERASVTRRAGILLLAALGAASTSDVETVTRCLRGASSEARLAALGAVQKWLLRGGRVAPVVSTFLRSEDLAGEVARARRDSDSLIRLAGDNCARMLIPDARRRRGPHRRTP